MPSPPHAVVATHGHCFDGMASAVLFTHLVRAVEPGAASRAFVYRGQTYDAGKNGVDPTIFAGATTTAILDFRYTATDALTWYFDHHASAFPTSAERAHFDRLAARDRGFYDGAGSSCTKLLAEVATARFGVDMSRFEDLVRWADMIDSAAFPTPELAVDRTAPVMKLLAVVERHGDDALLTDLVGRLLERPIEEVAAAPDLAARYPAVDAGHHASVARIREREQRRDAVVFVDLLDAPIETVTKFVTYADFRDVPYSVIVSRSAKNCKVSVGYNPWSGVPRIHDISAICERRGGGGHPVVGAVALPLDVDRARAIALEIVAELNRPAP
ncbi:MAG: hypothetical protein NVS3B10_05960 [Polyangiales bacterium]